MTRVGDKFLELLRNKGEDMSRMFVFTDFADKIVDGMPQDHLPIGEIFSYQNCTLTILFHINSMTLI